LGGNHHTTENEGEQSVTYDRLESGGFANDDNLQPYWKGGTGCVVRGKAFIKNEGAKNPFIFEGTGITNKGEYG